MWATGSAKLLRWSYTPNQPKLTCCRNRSCCSSRERSTWWTGTPKSACSTTSYVALAGMFPHPFSLGTRKEAIVARVDESQRGTQAGNRMAVCLSSVWPISGLGIPVAGFWRQTQPRGSVRCLVCGFIPAQAALKNAFRALAQKKFDIAAAFFLLGTRVFLRCVAKPAAFAGGSLADAATLCVRDMHDFQLAIVLCRISDAPGSVWFRACLMYSRRGRCPSGRALQD